jgi:pyrroloquinoline quinone biosynthesis protein B
VCTPAWGGDPRVRPRTQSSVAATSDGESWVLFNASPDLPQHLRATFDLQPRRLGRHSPIVAAVLTSADVDHVAGLLSLRERQPFRLFALVPVLEALRASPIFDVLAEDVVERVPVAAGEPIDIVGLKVEIFAVPGKAPLYLEGAQQQIGSEIGETAGVMIADGGRKLAYVPGCAHLTPALMEKLRQADTLLFDGTLFTDGEMIAAGVGTKTGRRMGHIPISGEGGSLLALAALPAKRKVFVHVNNTNPILVEGSPEHTAVEQASFEVAYDGMELSL